MPTTKPPVGDALVADAVKVAADCQGEIEFLEQAAADLVAYELYISQRAEEALKPDGQPSEVIFNRSPLHAAVLLKQLIWHARQDIRILSGYLNPSVYGRPDVVSIATDFMTRKHGRATILLDWHPDGCSLDQRASFLETHPLLSAMRAAASSPEQLRVWSVPEPVAALYSFHFMVADRASFRFEQDRKKFDAVAQFGNPSLGDKFVQRFEEIWSASR